MIRISIPFFYGLGASLRAIAAMKPGITLMDAWLDLYGAESELGNLLGSDWFFPAVRSASGPGHKLVAAIHVLTQQTDFAKVLAPADLYPVTNALTEFETVCKDELANADAYFVTRKAGFDSSVLISNAEMNFSRDFPAKASGAIPDVREAGKCLAFEMSTAAGFHLMRAVEAVLRVYWDVVTENKPHPRQRNLGVYLKKMDNDDIGNAKVRACLRQIKDLHRNPLAHPEETLTLDEAVGLFGIAQSAINAMLKEIPLPPQRTTGLLAGVS